MKQKTMSRAKATYRTNPIYKKYVPSFEGRYLFYFGGGGSGKSIDMYYRVVHRIITEHDGKHKILCIRKVARTIEQSIWDGILGVIDALNLREYFDIKEQKRLIIYKINGNKIAFIGVSDSERLKSIAGVTSVAIEEGTELSKKEWMQIGLRLRGKTKYIKQIMTALNPIDEDHFLCQLVEPQINGIDNMPKNIKNLKYLEDNVWEFDTMAVSGKSVKTRVINTTYIHNRFIDDDYIDHLNTLGSISENYYTVYVQGRWGRVDLGDAYIHQFKESIQKRQLTRNEDEPIHYTVDFNVSPYMSGLVVQSTYVQGGYWNGFSDYHDVRILDEIALEHPRNDARALGEELVSRYDTTKGMYLYGDASGNNRTGLRDVRSLFGDLKKGLGFKPQERIPRSNPKYAAIEKGSLGRALFLNMLFSGKLPIRIRVDQKCKNLLDDLKYCVQGTDGKMDKKKRDGHHLDALTYYLCHEKTFAYLAKKK